MDAKTLQELKGQLEAKRLQVISDLENIAHRAAGEDNFDTAFPEYGESMEDNATEVENYNNNLSLEKDLEKELNDIDGALKKIEKGTYGTCAYCGKEIEVDRLRARPASNSCIDCKKRLTSK